MSYDFDAMLQTVKEKQWSLADIDWEAPGAETMSEATRARLKPFMADLVWIEHIGARGFAALATKAPTPTIRELYRYFHAEEQKHANAELALMKRWGMLDGDRIPEPTIQVKMAIKVLDDWGDSLPLGGLAALIPLLEVALDGALVKFLTDEVSDPVCAEVFRHINSDEARHITTDFEVMELLGMGSTLDQVVKAAVMLDPRVLVGLVAVFIPLIAQMRNKVIAMGLDEAKLTRAIGRYGKIGSRGVHTQRLVSYQFLRLLGDQMMDPRNLFHRVLADPLVSITNHVPRSLLGKPQSWVDGLSPESVAS